MLGQFLRAAYGVYAMAAFVLVVLLVFCPLLIAAPFLRLRRSIGRLTVRAWLWSIGIHLRVNGLENLPDGPCVVVCNHASYVDGIVLTAALPERFTFLVMHHVEGWPYIGLIIRRMGVQFVNREDTRKAATATRQLIRRIRQGESLAIFPEGTFVRKQGLQPFFRGAFFIAAKTSVPVVPVALRGSRTLFPDGATWPRWSPLTIEVFPRLPVADDSAPAINSSRHHAWHKLVAEIGETAGDDPPPVIEKETPPNPEADGVATLQT